MKAIEPRSGGDGGGDVEGGGAGREWACACCARWI